MASEAKFSKNKTTLFYDTQKVGEIKVVLFFAFFQFDSILAIFLFLTKNL